jgi:hypothetical protein
MIQENKTVAQIATLRMLSESTILGHVANLIKQELIEIEQVLSPERLAALQTAFEGYAEESLTPLKEKYGNEFSWDELKLYRASLLK